MQISIYKVQDEPIGSGGMGHVYLAHDKNNNRVAIKEMRAEFVADSSLRARFHQEIELMNRFDHHSIVKMYGSFEANENLYMVMEFIDGVTLDKFVRLRGYLPEEESVRILTKVLNALEYAHHEGVIHRDIKPSNIMFKNDGSVCLLDFGIAKIMNRNGLTVGQLTIGTSGYMSPEQAEGLTINQLTDVYSMGCVLYFMLTGQHAFNKQANDHATRITIIQNDFPRAKEIRPEISDHIQNILDKATRKNMHHRFQSCAEFEMAISNNSGTISVNGNRWSISVGRGNCDVKIYDPQNRVSSHHADIEYEPLSEGYRYVFIDRSTNGTMVNGERIHRESREVYFYIENGGRGSIPKYPEIYLACNQNFKLDWKEVLAKFDNKQNKPEPKKRPDLSPPTMEPPVQTDETLTIGWYLLAFIFPIVGWVMYYQWKDKNKVKAKKIGITSMIGFVLGFVLNIIIKYS